MIESCENGRIYVRDTNADNQERVLQVPNNFTDKVSMFFYAQANIVFCACRDG